MFALGAWIFLLYDENHHPYLLVLMAGTTLAIAGGVWLFLRSSSVKVRILSTVGSFLAAAILGGIAWGTWSWHDYYGIPNTSTWFEDLGRSLIGTVFWIGILYWPALIGLIRRIVTRRTI
jgi:hypothetical protein